MVVRYLIFSLFSLVFCFNLAYGKTIYGKAKVIDGEELAEHEHLLRYTNWSRGTRIGTDSFFFQEGHGNDYAQARYGELKVAPTGESILVTLRNSDMTEAGPPPKKAVIDER